MDFGPQYKPWVVKPQYGISDHLYFVTNERAPLNLDELNQIKQINQSELDDPYAHPDDNPYEDGLEAMLW